ncbi:hypothetical protein BD309DRAFT_560763 [Dichomitus squalens]|nr:hypothetical protein BD309DRAFT_560763 [Dichomitus squalens]
MRETGEDGQQGERRDILPDPRKRQRLHDRLKVRLSLDGMIERFELLHATEVDIREEKEEAPRMELAAGESESTQRSLVAGEAVDDFLDNLPWKRRGVGDCTGDGTGGEGCREFARSFMENMNRWRAPIVGK